MPKKKARFSSVDEFRLVPYNVGRAWEIQQLYEPTEFELQKNPDAKPEWRNLCYPANLENGVKRLWEISCSVRGVQWSSVEEVLATMRNLTKNLKVAVQEQNGDISVTLWDKRKKSGHI